MIYNVFGGTLSLTQSISHCNKMGTRLRAKRAALVIRVHSRRVEFLLTY